jgi:hypothetical protein
VCGKKNSETPFLEFQHQFCICRFFELAIFVFGISVEPMSVSLVRQKAVPEFKRRSLAADVPQNRHNSSYSGF